MFTWKPIFKEIVDRLPEFQFKNAMLVDLMVKMHRESLKVSPMPPNGMPLTQQGNRRNHPARTSQSFSTQNCLAYRRSGANYRSSAGPVSTCSSVHFLPLNLDQSIEYGGL